MTSGETRRLAVSNTGRIAIGWCLAVAAMNASPAVAQDTSRAAASSDENVIIVTAQRRSELLEDVPAAIQTIDAEALKTAQVTRFQDLQIVAPSVQAGRTGILNQVAIRGVTTTFAGGGQETNVAVYVDGFYNADQLSINQDFANIESVEILKGPQGALYGRNATGGAILIKTRSPTDRFEADVTGTYAPRFDNRKIEAFVGGPLDERTRFSVAGYWRKDDGYVRDINNFAPNAPIRPDNPRPRTGNKSAEFENWSIRPKLEIDLAPDVKFTLGYVHAFVFDNRSVAYRVAGHVPGSPTSLNGYPLATVIDTTSLNFKPANQTELDEFQLTGEFGLGFGTLTARSAYRKQDDFNYYDLDATPRDPASGPGSLNGGGDNHRKTYIGQLDFASELDGPISFLAGFFYYNDKYLGNNFFDTGAALPITNLTYKTEAWAVYLDGTYTIGDLHLTVGGRYSEDRKSAYSITALPNGFVILSSGSAAYTTDPDGIVRGKSTNFSPRAVLRYNLGPGTNIYASVSRGFKSGTVSSSAPFNFLKPETVTAYEAGFKTSRGGFRADLSAFYYDFNNSQVAVLDPSLPTVTSLLQNSGGSRIYGVDGTISYRVTERFNVRAALAYLHSRYTDFDNATNTVVDPVTNLNTSVQGSWSGRRTIRSPDWSGSVAADYTADLAGGQLVISGNATFASRYPISNASYDCTYSLQGGINRCVPGTDNGVRGRFEENGYVLASGQVAWTDPSDHWTFTVFASNITGARYRIASVGLFFGDYISFNEPRTVGASIRFRY